MTKVIAGGIFLLLLYTSCQKGDFLDKTETTDLTEPSVFSDSARTMDFLTGIYADISFSFNPSRFGNAGLDASSDEAEGPGTNSSSMYLQWATGSVNQASVTGDAWYTCYTNIRRVNRLLKNLPVTPLSGTLKNQVKGQALFLRAWYYSTLLKHYGGVKLVGDTLYDADDFISADRNTYAECVDYILQQCDDAAQLLPLEYFSKDHGRVTKGARLALKARVLLYAASPLFNGEQVAGADPLRSITGYPSVDMNRWKLAADAAKAVMDLGIYQLHEDNTTAPGYGFYEVFTLRKNEEYILAGMRPANRELEGLWLPSSRGGMADNTNPYQELVDAFPMKNGLPITDAGSGYDPTHPYANRDPRFDYSIIHNESLVWKNSGPKIPLYTYAGYPQDGVYVGTSTGYYVFKMLQDNVVPNNFGQTNRCFPLIRYAEILLDYAEAMNEFSGPGQEVYDALEAIRKRAGLDPYTLPTGLDRKSVV